MQNAAQTSKSACQGIERNKENRPSEFTISPYLHSICVQRAVMDPSPQQQGLKLKIDNRRESVACDVMDPSPQQQGLKH
jgi:hypothetical protein